MAVRIVDKWNDVPYKESIDYVTNGVYSAAYAQLDAENKQLFKYSSICFGSLANNGYLNKTSKLLFSAKGTDMSGTSGKKWMDFILSKSSPWYQFVKDVDVVVYRDNKRNAACVEYPVDDTTLAKPLVNLAIALRQPRENLSGVQNFFNMRELKMFSAYSDAELLSIIPFITYTAPDKIYLRDTPVVFCGGHGCFNYDSQFAPQLLAQRKPRIYSSSAKFRKTSYVPSDAIWSSTKLRGDFIKCVQALIKGPSSVTYTSMFKSRYSGLGSTVALTQEKVDALLLAIQAPIDVKKDIAA